MAESLDMITKWLERIETKLDGLSERVVTRGEFERYKLIAQKDHDHTKVQIEKIRDQASAREKETQNRKEEEAMKMRLFWSGLILTPIVTISINFLIMRGGA